ncbi:MAG: DNA internalization-related competence protein ComEC/Rec2 [Gammaproteobacteria bacterium]|nr:DNA internalization-related competence protein ComEC/Rec2 [Gammaproteobacteria bacterium]
MRLFLLLCFTLLLRAFFSLPAAHLPATLHHQKIVSAEGIISSVPQISNNRARFTFLVSRLNSQTTPPLTFHLSWHYPPPVLHVGERWLLPVGLQALHGPTNPGGFNDEQWALSHQVAARGFVLAAGDYSLLGTHYGRFWLAHLRESLAQHITDLTHSPYSPFLTALSVGLRQSIDDTQWQTLQATGTNHLIAIAGLHIGFLSSFMMGAMYFIWRRSARLPLFMPAPIAAALTALVSAFVYSALAGFALPTVRALIMLSLFLFAIVSRRACSSLHSFLFAVVIVLLLTPFAPLEDSFWLSFGSVALIFYGTQGRLAHPHPFIQGLKLQAVLSVGLLPFSILFFQQISGVSFISNAVAIPVVGWLILPLCFLGILFIPCHLLSQACFLLANNLFSYLWWFLEKMAHLPYLHVYLAFPSSAAALSAFIGMLIALAPRGLPARFLSFFWFLPVWIHYFPLPEQAVKLSIFDLDKGQSVLIQTAHHALLFDVGKELGEQNDAFTRSIVPFLRIAQLSAFDTLIISHQDNQDQRNTQALLNQFPVQHIFSHDTQLFANGPVQPCLAGTQWEWDQVHFKLIYPTQITLEPHASCVLLITTPYHHAFLVTGPLEAGTLHDLLSSPLPASFTLITPPSRYTRDLALFIEHTGVERIIFSGSGTPPHFKLPPLIPLDHSKEHGMISVYSARETTIK